MKLKNSHFLLMILCCLAMAAAFLFLPKIIKGNLWYLLLILACPLSHLLMMKGVKHSETGSRQSLIKKPGGMNIMTQFAA
jgi:hypothetical protein